MSIYLRQICLVSSDLNRALEDLTSVLGLSVCYVDEGVSSFGLGNSLLRIGTQFLEVVAPVKEDTAAGRYLERRKGDGGYMVIHQTDQKCEQQAAIERAEKDKVRIAFFHEHISGNYLQFHPADTGGAFLELDYDTHQDPSGNWHPAGGVSWRQSNAGDAVNAIAGAELQSQKPEQLAAKWAKLLGLDYHPCKRGFQIKLGNGSLNFVEMKDSRGEGLRGIDLLCDDAEDILTRAREHALTCIGSSVEICGTWFNLNDGPS